MDTDSDLSDSSSRSSRIVVDLITPDPDRVTDHMPPEELFILTRQQRQIPFDRPHEIGEINLMAWVQSKDPLRLTISYLAKSKASWKFKLLRLVRRKEPDELWNDHILPACNPATPYKPGSSAKGDLAIKFVRLFWQHVSCTLTAAIFTRALSKRMMEEVPLKRDQFDEFIDFLKRHVIPYMDSEGPAKRVSNIFTAPAEHDEDVKPEVQAGEDVTMDSDKTDSDDEADSGDQVEDGGAYLSSGKNRKRVRPVVRDAAAEKLREDVNDRVKAQERRTNQLRERLAKSETITKEQARLIINTSKEGDDDSAFISVSTKSDHGRPSIADRIKDHQIDGVRFMWNHLTANQGCLLAHTMGLGKTMQVITVLVAIREAAISPKPAINSQIPEDLRGTTRILILCPAGLVDNWIEELAIWAPDDVFTPGESIRHVDPDTPVDDRGKLINAWAEVGGILVIGYDLFRIIHEGSEELGEHLTSGPDIVIADESHRLKNRATKLATITATFRTMRRVALSGTPLANNIGEYYSAMEWIAPNFLGPFKEFTAVYVEPIETGLFAESSGPEFRRAKKMLAALEKTVAPKTHRLTMACLKEQLPSKMEFVITMPMTPLQVSLYKLYIASLSSVAGDDGVKSNSTVFAVATNLALICSHPKCFHQRLVHQRQKREAHRIGVEPDTDSTLTPIFVSEALRLFSRQKDVASMQHSWKVLHLIKILDECRKTKEKVLIFSQSLPTLDFLENLLRQQGRSMVKLTGSTESKARQTMVRDFNFSDTQEVFLISTTAGGIGLNITGASRVVIFDVKYNPVTELQAIGRAYRMGQKRNVVVYRFLKAGTYEKHIYNKHVFKTQLASRVVDKENPKRSSSKFGDLIRPLDEDVPFEDLSEHVGRDGILDAMLAQQAQQKSINSILTADTFDEEDPDDTALSAEERKEVESMIEMNRIRHTDPARFALLEQQMSMQRAAEQHRMMAESASRQKAERADAANSYNVQRAAEQQRLMADAASRHGTHNVPRPPVGPFRPYNPATQTTATNAQSTATAGLPPVGPQIPPLLAPQPASQTAPGSTSQTGAQSVVQRPLIVHQYNPPGVPGAGPLAAPNGSQGATHSASQPVPQVPQLAHQPVSRGSPQVGGPSSQQAAPKNVPPVAAPAAPQTAHRSTPEGRVVLGGPRWTMPSIAPQKTPSAAPRTPSTSGQAPTATPNMPLSEGVPGGKGSRVMDSTPASPPTRDARLKRQMGIFAKKVYQGTVFDKQNKGEMSDAPDVIIGKATAIGEAVRTIQIERNGGFLPDTNRWNQLLDLADVPLFCGDITEGRLSVLNLVDGDLSKYMPGQIQKHGAASAAKASPATSAMGKDNSKDPNVRRPNHCHSTWDIMTDTQARSQHLSKALSRTDPPASSPGTPSSSRAQEDMIALRKVADRRKNRPLPPWANNALEDAK
jgi:SNF2 family DNA or RNA helicase